MNVSSYYLWSFGVINSAIFILFGFSLFKPRTRRDWQAFGAFSAFIVTLFTEMNGFPLTSDLLAGWLQGRFPHVDWLALDSRHLLEVIRGWTANPHFGPPQLLSVALINGGFILLATAWPVLYQAWLTGTVAVTGPYAWVRHPQYVGFLLIMVRVLFQGPTLLTLAILPILLVMYCRISRHEERAMAAEFGETYRRYATRVPRFVPQPPARPRRPVARSTDRVVTPLWMVAPGLGNGHQWGTIAAKRVPLEAARLADD